MHTNSNEGSNGDVQQQFGHKIKEIYELADVKEK